MASRMDELHLTPEERSILGGDAGEGAQFAMALIVRLASAMGAERLVPIGSAHVDGCLYHGQVSLDFVERLRRGGARVTVSTTLNSSSLDLLHPDLFRGDPHTGQQARRLMDGYVALGCRPTWTCAPYQGLSRPRPGEHVGWAESNAVVFANSVLGARTNRYGDFVDICAGITGRVPLAGLHLDRNRLGTVLYRTRLLPPDLLHREVFYPVLGHLIGLDVGGGVPVIEGVPPDVTEDRLKAFGAAAASSGAVGLFHMVTVTPEAPSVARALGGREPERVVDLTPEMLIRARDALSTNTSARLAAVSLGTPHFSLEEFDRLVVLVGDRRVRPDVDFYVSTSRAVLAQLHGHGWEERLRRAGVTLVTDTCTYITPILRPVKGVVMTNSAKWAYYAPGNLRVEVAFGSMEECVESAVRGEVWHDRTLWRQ